MRFKKEEPAGRVMITIKDRKKIISSTVLDTTSEEIQGLVTETFQSKVGGTPTWNERVRTPRIKGEKKAKKTKAA